MMQREELLVWLTEVRHCYSIESSTNEILRLNFAANSASIVSKLIFIVKTVNDRYVCYMAGCTLKALFCHLSSENWKQACGKLLPTGIQHSFCSLSYEISLEVVVCALKNRRRMEQFDSDASQVFFTEMCLLITSLLEKCFLSQNLIIFTLKIAKQLLKTDCIFFMEQCLNKLHQGATKLIAHCSTNRQVAKLLSFCTYTLKVMAGIAKDDLVSLWLRSILTNVLRSPSLLEFYKGWFEACVVIQDTVPQVIELPRDCSDREHLSELARNLFVLFQQCAITVQLVANREMLSSFGLAVRQFQEVTVSCLSEQNRDLQQFCNHLDKLLLSLISEHDSVLFDVMTLCVTLHRGNTETFSSGVPEDLAVFSRLCEPHMLFIRFLASISFDPSTLLEFVLSKDDTFINFLSQYLSYASQSWALLEAACERLDNDLGINLHDPETFLEGEAHDSTLCTDCFLSGSGSDCEHVPSVQSKRSCISVSHEPSNLHISCQSPLPEYTEEASLSSSSVEDTSELSGDTASFESKGLTKTIEKFHSSFFVLSLKLERMTRKKILKLNNSEIIQQLSLFETLFETAAYKKYP